MLKVERAVVLGCPV